MIMLPRNDARFASAVMVKPWPSVKRRARFSNASDLTNAIKVALRCMPVMGRVRYAVALTLVSYASPTTAAHREAPDERPWRIVAKPTEEFKHDAEPGSCTQVPSNVLRDG